MEPHGGGWLTGVFVHLHTHTEFSMLDGAARVDDLVEAAVERRPARARDHRPREPLRRLRLLRGVPRARASRRSSAPRPTWRGSRATSVPCGAGASTTPAATPRAAKLYYHLTLLAESNAGYSNLLKLSSAAFLEGYYYKPRVDWELLERHHEGLIATSGCLGGVVLQALLAGDDEGALKKAARLQDIFGRDGFFIELQDHGLDASSARPTRKLVEIARSLVAPLLATNDSHYTPPRRRRRARRAAVRADRRAARRREAVPVRGHRALPEVRRRDAPPVRRRGGGLRQHAAHRRARERRDRVRPPVRCPSSTCPRGSPGRPTRRGPRPTCASSPTRARSTATATPLPDVVRERLDYELGVIENMGFPAYFLVVWDLIRYARENRIRVGPGPRVRGGELRRVLPRHRRPRPVCATTCSSSGS